MIDRQLWPSLPSAAALLFAFWEDPAIRRRADHSHINLAGILSIVSQRRCSAGHRDLDRGGASRALENHDRGRTLLPPDRFPAERARDLRRGGNKFRLIARINYRSGIISDLMDLDPEEGTEEFDRLDVLATLVAAYEAQHHPTGFPHPVEAIKIRMEDLGISRRDLCSATSISESKLSEVLNLRRSSSLSMIRNIGPVFGLPLELLVQPCPVTERQAVDA